MTATRNIDLTPRLEETRERQHIHIISFEFDEIKSHFEENLENIRNHFTVSEQLYADNKIEAAKDIWRSQILFLESALDFHIHEITKYVMPKILNGEWEQTQKFKNYSLKLSSVIDAIRRPEDTSWFLESINQTYATFTFMSYKSIKEQMNLIGIDYRSIADEAFHEQDSSEVTIDKFKQTLDDLFNRRNAIAHQSDRNHHDAIRKDIDKEYVVQSIDNIQNIVTAINKCIELKNATG